MAAMDRDALLAQVRLETVIEDTHVSDAEIVLLLNQGVDEIGVAAWWPFLESSTTITLVATQKEYALPNDFEFALALVDDDNDETIPYMAAQQVFNMYGNDTGNDGTSFNFWTIWGTDIKLYPTPSAADTNRLTLYYYSTTTQLSAGATTPDWHEAFHSILVEYAKWKLYNREEYFDQSERAFIQYNRYLRGMHDYYSRKAKRTPYIAGDGIWRPQQGDPNLPWVSQV